MACLDEAMANLVVTGVAPEMEVDSEPKNTQAGPLYGVEPYMYRDMNIKQQAWDSANPRFKYVREGQWSFYRENERLPTYDAWGQFFWQRVRREILLKPQNFWDTPQQAIVNGNPTGGYSSEYGAGQALRNAVNDGLWRLPEEIVLHIVQFILPPWFDRYFGREFVPEWEVDRLTCLACGWKGNLPTNEVGITKWLEKATDFWGNKRGGGAAHDDVVSGYKRKEKGNKGGYPSGELEKNGGSRKGREWC